MTSADPVSTTSASADPTTADPTEVVTFSDIDDPLLWVKSSARTDIAIVDHDEAWAAQYAELAAAIRSLLGDRVLQRVAWRVAEQLGWEDTLNAEYVALTQLQADALVTLDQHLADSVEGLVAVAPIDDLL